MNTWLITAIIIGVLFVSGVALASALSVNQETPAKITGCSSCGNSCTAENNCGLATCGAVDGGTCSCGK